MNSLSNTIQVSKPTYRFYGFITDRVFITLVMAFSGLAILDQTQAYQSLRFTLQSMIGIAPFFFLAVAFAGYAKATGFDYHIARVFSGKSWAAIIAASRIGQDQELISQRKMFTPLCTPPVSDSICSKLCCVCRGTNVNKAVVPRYIVNSIR